MLRLALATLLFLPCLTWADESPREQCRRLIKELESPDYQTRKQATLKLTKLGPDAAEAAPALIEALADWRLQRLTTKALCKIGPKARPHLLRALVTFSENKEVSYALLPLIQEQGPDTAPKLIKLSRKLKPDSPALYWIVYMLSHWQPPADETIDFLTHLVLRRNVEFKWSEVKEAGHPYWDDDPDGVRGRATYSLASLGPKGCEALRAIWTRRHAQSAPVLLAWPSWRRFLDSLDSAQPSAEPWLNLSAWRKQWPILAEDLRDPGASSRAIAIEALGEVQKPADSGRWLREIANTLDDPHPRVRQAAGYQLWLLFLFQPRTEGVAEVLPALRRALRDQGYDVHKKEKGFGSGGTLWHVYRGDVRRSDSGFHSHRTVQNHVARALKELGPAAGKILQEDGVPQLLQALQSKDAYVRTNAIEALGNLGPVAKAAVPALIDQLWEHKANRRLKKLLGLKQEYDAFPGTHDYGFALAGIGRGALPQLIKLLESNEPADAKLALEVLGYMQRLPVDILPQLLARLKDDDQETQLLAVTALGRIGPKATAAIDPLKALLKDADSKVGWEAANAVLTIDPHDAESRARSASAAAKPSDAEEAKNQKTLPELLEDLKERKEFYTALWHLEKMGPRAAGAAPALIEVAECANLSFTDTLNVRVNTLAVLGKIGVASPKVLPFLIRCLDDDDRGAITAAALALGEIGPRAKAATPRLKKLLTSEAVRLEAAFALILVTAEVRPYLDTIVAALPDPNKSWSAAHMLDTLGVRAVSAVDAIRESLRDPNTAGSYACRHLVNALGKMGPAAKSAVPELAAVLQDSYDANRGSALEALENLGGHAEKVLPALARFMEEAETVEEANRAERAYNRIAAESLKNRYRRK